MLWKDKTGSEPSFISKAKEENTVMKSEKILKYVECCGFGLIESGSKYGLGSGFRVLRPKIKKEIQLKKLSFFE
jgi:hypothetical protein